MHISVIIKQAKNLYTVQGILQLLQCFYQLASIFAVQFQTSLGVICVPLQEIPLKKWVLKQGGKTFAFADPKYFSKFLDDNNY